MKFLKERCKNVVDNEKDAMLSKYRDIVLNA